MLNLFQATNQNTLQNKKETQIKKELKKYINKTISSDVFKQATKMNVNLTSIFSDMVLSEERRKKAENVISHLAGIVGTV